MGCKYLFLNYLNMECNLFYFVFLSDVVAFYFYSQENCRLNLLMTLEIIWVFLCFNNNKTKTIFYEILFFMKFFMLSFETLFYSMHCNKVNRNYLVFIFRANNFKILTLYMPLRQEDFC